MCFGEVKKGAQWGEQRQGDGVIRKSEYKYLFSCVLQRCMWESVAVTVKRLAAPKLPLHIFCLADRSQTDYSSTFLFTPPKYTNYSGPGLNVSCRKVEKEKVADE